MSSSEVLDFEKICRLCLSEKRSMSAIFSKKKSDCKVPLSVRIMSCGALQLYEGDGLPASICSKCLANVNQSYAFREQCEQADNTLRQYLQRKNEIADEEEPKIEAELQLETEPEPEMDLETENEPEASTFVPEVLLNEDETKERCTAKKKHKKRTNIEEDNLNGVRSLKECDICLQPFRYVSSLLLHKKDVHDSTVFTCAECPTQAATWAEYEKHRKVHKHTISCDVCSKEFEYINSLVQHRRVTHRDNRDYMCTLCGSKWNVYKDYKHHLRLSHKDSGVKLSLSCLICDICGKEFLCHYNLSTHRKFHENPQFECTYCHKYFKTKKSLFCHERTHTGERPFTCETCGKSFPGKSYLINHSFTHTGQKPFVCEVCQKAFSKKWNMIQHARIHSGERPYKCPLCSVGFIQNFILKEHMKKVHNCNLDNFKKQNVS